MITADKFLNDSPFEHLCHYGTQIKSSRCDFREGVEVHHLEGAKIEHIMADIGEVMGWHAMNIIPRLNGFNGYDCLKYTFVPGLS